MQRNYVDPSDCEVIRGLEEHPGMAVLMDCDGEKLLIVPADEWTDQQIFTALNFANQAYRHGANAGRVQKMMEIRRALELDA